MVSSEPETPRALVTGAGVRVGRAIALALGRAGHDVAVHYNASEEPARATAEEIRAMGRRAVHVGADLTDLTEITALFDRVDRELGGLELLVNSAAIFPRSRPETVTPEGWERVFALNARAPFFCAQEAFRIMENGSIVNIADVAAYQAWPAYAPYSATKAALVSLTHSLALAWAPRVRVNAVAPGPVLLPEGTTEAERQHTIESTAVGRIGSPEDVAGAVLYLARARFVTGEVIQVDGGEHLKRTRHK